MTKQLLHPELGSGALGMALAEHEFEQYYLRCGCSCGWGTTLAESKSHWALWTKHFAEVLALSLSSPIEPSKEQLKDACEVCETCGFHCIDRRTEQVRKLFAPTTAQASSEIREVERIAQEMCRLAAEMHHTASGYAYQKLGEYGKQILDALSPSRQGAGGERNQATDADREH